jgi:hypothetical protein
MGRFAAYLYSTDGWVELEPESETFDVPAAPWLYLSIHDSDFAIVRFAPNAPGTGTAFVGATPRDYFDDPQASAPTDPDQEAEGLAIWADAAATGAVPQPSAIRPLLVAEGAEQPDWDDPTLSEDDIFVEGKCVRLTALLGLPSPPDL